MKIQLRAIYKAIEAHQGRHGICLRLMKLSEEVGEVGEAFIGYVGGNKRKGITHEADDIAKELADVAITALVALHDWTEEPERFFLDRLTEIDVRVKREGS